MTNTERYFNSIKCFRKDLSDLNAKYAPEYERLERFKDSTSYASSKKSVDERREEELSALRREYNDRLKSAVDAMEKRIWKSLHPRRHRSSFPFYRRSNSATV